MRMWVDQRPQSFFDQSGAGSFYANQASNARGDKASSEVSRNQASKMLQLNEKAVGYLQKAMQLDAHSALPHGVMMGIAANEGKAAGQSAQQWMQSGTQIEPKNLFARISAMNDLSPRWSGSFDVLDGMVQQASKTLPSQSVRYLQYHLVVAKPSHQEVIEKSKPQAHALPSTNRR